MRHLLATVTLLAGLAAAAPAAAEPHRRVVILRFDGPTQLADEARELVMDAAGHDNDVVALGRWADAHKAAGRKLRGARAWAKSASEAQVDAIIEGSVRRGRRGYQLELVVREAATGNQVDSVELQVDDDRKAERIIEGELTDLLAWVEPPAERRDLARLDRRRDRDDRADRDDRDDRDRRADRDDSDRDDDRGTRADDRDDDRRARKDRDDRDRDDRDRDDRRARKGDRGADRDRDAERDRDDDRDVERDGDDDGDVERDGDDDRGADRDRDAERDRDDDRDAEDSDGFGFAPDRAERAGRDLADETAALLDGERVLGGRQAPAGTRAAMLRIAGGGYVTSRALGLAAPGGGAAPGADGGHPTVGVQVRAEVFPLGETGAGRRLTGLGLRLDYGRAVGNKVAVQVDGQPTQLDVAQQAWSAAVAYRRPLSVAILQLDLGYGSTAQAIVGKPMSVAVVDASYGYVRGGARVELPVAGKATVGAGAHYLYLTSAPAMQELGAPSATGLDADASVEVPLTSSLTALAGVDYQRISLTFSGPSAMASAATDTFLSARLALGFTY